MCTKCLQSILTVALVLGASTHASGAILYESGTLGPTGVSWDQLENQTVPGTNISSFAYNGVRFELTQRVLTNAIGGHFVGSNSGTFFGAIIALDGADDFPNSEDLSTPDVLGTTLLDFPISSAEVFGDLALSLGPGWYAVVFGSGLFGATTDGGAVRNGMDIEDPSYIAYGLNLNWYNLDIFDPHFDNHRFVVSGSLVPEPSTLILLVLVVLWPRRHALS